MSSTVVNDAKNNDKYAKNAVFHKILPLNIFLAVSVLGEFRYFFKSETQTPSCERDLNPSWVLSAIRDMFKIKNIFISKVNKLHLKSSL